MFTTMKVTKKSYEDVINLPIPKHEKPVRGIKHIRKLAYKTFLNELNENNFTYKKIGMEKLKKNEPAIYIMNHSCSVDLEILVKLIGNRHFYIVGTHDAFIGKKTLMKYCGGIIPAKKLIPDLNLITDVSHVLNNLKCSIFLLPEAS